MRLNQWLESHGKTKAQFSRETGLSKATVSRLCAGIVVPSKEHANTIYLETGGAVTPNDFYLDQTELNPVDQA